MRFLKAIPGIEPLGTEGRNCPPGKTDLPVMLPLQSNTAVASPLLFSHWITSRSALWLMLATVFCCLVPAATATAATNFGYLDALQAFWRWVPLLVKEGFVLNVLISVFTMLFGTIFGVLLGLAQISLFTPIRWAAELSW